MSGIGRRRTAGRVVALALLATSTGGCMIGRGGAASPGPVVSTGPMRLQVSVAGAVEVDLTGGDIQVQTIQLEAAGPGATSLYSLVMQDPVTVGDLQVRSGFDLLGYRGDGGYTIGPGLAKPSLDESASAAPDLSNARFDYVDTVEDPDTIRTFNDPVDACTVEIRNRGDAGTLECARLADEEGREVALTLRWQR